MRGEFAIEHGVNHGTLDDRSVHFLIGKYVLLGRSLENFVRDLVVCVVMELKSVLAEVGAWLDLVGMLVALVSLPRGVNVLNSAIGDQGGDRRSGLLGSRHFFRGHLRGIQLGLLRAGLLVIHHLISILVPLLVLGGIQIQLRLALNNLKVFQINMDCLRVLSLVVRTQLLHRRGLLLSRLLLRILAQFVFLMNPYAMAIL